MDIWGDYRTDARDFRREGEAMTFRVDPNVSVRMKIHKKRGQVLKTNILQNEVR
jgi:hypothetical protein